LIAQGRRPVLGLRDRRGGGYRADAANERRLHRLAEIASYLRIEERELDVGVTSRGRPVGRLADRLGRDEKGERLLGLRPKRISSPERHPEASALTRGP